LELVHPGDDAVLRSADHCVAEPDLCPLECGGSFAHRGLAVGRAVDATGEFSAQAFGLGAGGRDAARCGTSRSERLIRLRTRGNAFAQQRALARGLALRVHEPGLGGLDVGQGRAEILLLRPDVSPRRRDLRFGLGHRRERSVVSDAEQDLALGHPLIFVNLDGDDLAVDIGCNADLARLERGVLGSFVAPAAQVEIQRANEHHDGRNQ
jgi:hypothetical protein